MIDRHKVHKKILSPARFGDVLCGKRSAKFGTNNNHLVTCKACQRLLNEQRSKSS
jgi:hypothetical protein